MWFITRPSSKKFPPYITILTLSLIVFLNFSQTYNTEYFIFERFMHTCLFLCACVSVCTHVFVYAHLCKHMEAKREHWKSFSIPLSLSLWNRVYSWAWDYCFLEQAGNQAVLELLLSLPSFMLSLQVLAAPASPFMSVGIWILLPVVVQQVLLTVERLSRFYKFHLNHNFF